MCMLSKPFTGPERSLVYLYTAKLGKSNKSPIIKSPVHPHTPKTNPRNGKTAAAYFTFYLRKAFGRHEGGRGGERKGYKASLLEGFNPPLCHHTTKLRGLPPPPPPPPPFNGFPSFSPGMPLGGTHGADRRLQGAGVGCMWHLYMQKVSLEGEKRGGGERTGWGMRVYGASRSRSVFCHEV